MTQHRNLPVPLDFPEQPMLIEHILNGDVIPQRPRDGYINATLLCQKSGKAFSDYSRLARTQSSSPLPTNCSGPAFAAQDCSGLSSVV